MPVFMTRILINFRTAPCGQRTQVRRRWGGQLWDVCEVGGLADRPDVKVEPGHMGLL